MERQSKEMDQGGQRGIHLALDVLELLASEGRPLGLSDLADRLGLPKSTAHRVISALDRRGYASQDSSDRYALGVRCFELGNLWTRRLDLRRAAMPHLQVLNAETAETVHLAIYDHGEVVYIEKLECRHPVTVSSYVGRRCPAYCVATGRMLLACQPEAEIDSVLEGPLDQHTSATVTDPAELRAMFAQARRVGYAVNHGSYRDGVGGLAAPVRDHTGAVVAAVGCCLPEMRFSGDSVDHIMRCTVTAAVAISAALGAPAQATAAGAPNAG